MVEFHVAHVEFLDNPGVQLWVSHVEYSSDATPQLWVSHVGFEGTAQPYVGAITPDREAEPGDEVLIVATLGAGSPTPDGWEWEVESGPAGVLLVDDDTATYVTPSVMPPKSVPADYTPPEAVITVTPMLSGAPGAPRSMRVRVLPQTRWTRFESPEWRGAS